MEKVTEWYEENAEKQKQSYLRRLKEQQEDLDKLRAEIEKLKQQNQELSKTIKFQPDDLRHKPSSGASIVAQAVTSVVGMYELTILLICYSSSNALLRLSPCFLECQQSEKNSGDQGISLDDSGGLKKCIYRNGLEWVHI